MTDAFASPPARRQSSARSVSHVQTLVWLCLLAGVVGLFGGSSRFDAVQAAALRPLTALFLIPAFYWLSREKIAQARILVVLLGLLGLWMIVQLIPLPPSVWQALPGRDTIADLDAMHGLEGLWRPISFVPMRGWNALFALIIPAAGLLLVLALRPQVRTVLYVIVGLGVVDAALGVLQILSGNDSPLYFYTHTNLGAPVGLFANENHSGVFSAIVLLLIARLGFASGGARPRAGLNIALAAAFLVVTIGLLVSGSRAALGLGAFAYIAIAAIGWIWVRRVNPGRGKKSAVGILAGRPRLFLAIAIAIIGGVFFALSQFERTPGVSGALSQNALDDLRWRIAPILGDMMTTHWLLGTGFGSFDAVYQISEPREFLGPTYLNQAHNDWAQLVIEGGLPALALLAALGLWIYRSIRQMIGSDAIAAKRCIVWGGVVIALMVASIFDYPLRTPIFQLVAVWLMWALAIEAKQGRA